MVTNHEPQMKYWRNIITDRLALTDIQLGEGRQERGPKNSANLDRAGWIGKISMQANQNSHD
jgi:hypothetical protein